MKGKAKKITRQQIVTAFVMLSLFVIFVRLFTLQIYRGKENRVAVDRQLTLFKTVSAPRGDIADRYGRPIVTARYGWDLVLDEGVSKEVLKETSKRVETLLKGEETVIPFAEGLPLPHVLAEDLKSESVAKIKEYEKALPGVLVQERTVRNYQYPGVASHILGHIGKISGEEYEEKQKDGYQKTDYIGKQGVERAFETFLRGENGVKTVETEEKNPLVASKEPTPGKTVMLTLDIDLQIATEEALQKAVESTNEKAGGAALVVDVKSGDVLACASYPTYNLETFSKDYSALLNDPAKPMFHRALSGLYAPGSTFKMISAIAALEKGGITPEERIKTRGVYEYFDRTFQCNIYREKKETHGDITLAEALGVSCNYYFYEIGNRVGIEDIAETAERFSLGEKTGIFSGNEEAEGRIASRETREKMGGKWYAGDTLQAAIGQSDHLFTPVGLANYVAMLANGGKSPGLHILYGVKDAETGEIEKHTESKPQKDANVDAEILQEVIKGMQKVTEEEGTAGATFSEFEIPVAGKTGSAQVPGGTNGLFLGFAPVEKPQIAISVVIEKGGAGSLAARVGKEIFSEYFEKEAPAFSQRETPYTLLP